jgi:hypothetical protein
MQVPIQTYMREEIKAEVAMRQAKDADKLFEAVSFV